MTGTPWTFLAQPALSAREVKDAVKHILDARAQRAKEDEERKAKASAASATDAAERPSTSAAPTSQPPASTPTQSTGATPPQGAGSSGAQAGWVVVVAVLVMVLLLTLWLFVRSKRSAHAIIERYALFLSTLSYQHIRALRADEPFPAADRLSLANDDLTRYLRFIRGEGAYIDKAKAADLPVRLDPDLDLATFLSEPKNII